MTSYLYWDYKTQSWRNRKARRVKGRGLDIFERQFIMPLARRKRKTAAQQVRAQVVQKIGTAKTFRELKLYTYKALCLLDECLPQVFVCRVRARRRKTRPKRGR